MTAVELTEAGTDFAALLDRAERGEQITFTRAGRPVAMLGPLILPVAPPPGPEALAAFERMIAARDRRAKTLGPGPTIREMIEEGRM
ncbi:MAG: type II toxin-antitoxin system prevent-host-death family antitoxin [Gemmataceae bacterium]|nr:type II toxin-antitoxin system prevent-host-death family antitoxin [Gemmataceae bacterium]